MFREKRIEVLFGVLKIQCKQNWGLNVASTLKLDECLFELRKIR